MAKKKSKAKLAKAANTLKPAVASVLNAEVIPVALTTINQPVLMKVCRLCESKDGPFLNIFDADKVTAKKIDQLMPFVIAENDELPHKICFRCSAKVEELHEFVQKCVNTQESLHTALGKKGSIPTKTKTRKIWEEKLNKSNMTNDDICDALIKKAMEGIKDIPFNVLPVEIKAAAIAPTPPPLTVLAPKEINNQNLENEKSEEQDNLPLKQIKSDKIEKKNTPVRSSRSKTEIVPDTSIDVVKEKMTRSKRVSNKCTPNNSNKKVLNNTEAAPPPLLLKETKTSSKTNGTLVRSDLDDKSNLTNNFSLEESKSDNEPKEELKPFNIMDHVCMIKVNGVGVLFQCKLCNRNFLKEEVVKSHGCAKNGGPKLTEKVDLTKSVSPPEPPKAPTVKYINTKMDSDSKKPAAPSAPAIPPVPVPPGAQSKAKPKIGPASKIRRSTVDPGVVANTAPSNISVPLPVQPNPPVALLPSVQFPGAPSLKSRYKLIPGPNNTFTLVEDQASAEIQSTLLSKNAENVAKPVESKLKERKVKGAHKNSKKDPSPEVIDLDDQPNQPPSTSHHQPYPVGLFQTLPHHSGVFPQPATPQEAVFTTPAMKKQSYTVVQTGNPSKLLISTKPQPPVEEPPKKRQRKAKPESKADDNTEPKQPFTVTLEDAAPPKDAGFFTFINVDPLLQPSYVLPTDSIIQESQITTSTPVVKPATDPKEKDKYSCNMCGEKFSREKKMLAHIQSHYAQMDEEDQVRTDKVTRKRGKKT